MRHTALVALVASILAGAPSGAVPPPSWPDRTEALTLSFVAVESPAMGGFAGESRVDLGPISAASAVGRQPAIVVSRRVAVRLDSPSGAVAIASLSAFLSSETPGTTIRVDGVPLSIVPRVLDPMHRVGTSVVHQIEVTVPDSAPAGPLLSAITWIAESR